MIHQTWISGKAIRPLFAEPVTNMFVYIWNSNMLKWFGYSNSLVFIAGREETNEGTSLLWMDCTQPSKMCEWLGKLV